MIRRSVSLVLALIMCLFACAVYAEESEENCLYKLAEPWGFKMGAPISYNQMRDTKYLNFIAGQFNSVTTTNEMKAYSLLDQRASKAAADGMPKMNWTFADQMVGWAAEHGIGVRGHVLVWDAYMTDWYFREGFDSSKPYADQETVQKRTESYIRDVITHFEEKFPGTVYCWDVVNEAVGDSASEYAANDPRHLRTKRSGSDNLFRELMGDSYVELSFLYARNTVESLGADIKLYYNDYNAYFSDKAKAILALADSVNSFAVDENGNPRKLMDGIGMQGYIGGYGTQDGCLIPSHIGMIRDAIQGYAAKGLEVQITEMAVRNFDLNAAEKHASFYGDLFAMLKEINTPEDAPFKACSIWGLTDYPKEPKGTYVYNLNSPYGGLVTEKLEIKDAFLKVVEALK